jgi:hypothetical protein
MVIHVANGKGGKQRWWGAFTRWKALDRLSPWILPA